MAQEPSSAIPLPLTRRQRVRQGRVRRARRVLLLVVALALVLGAALPAAGYYVVFVRPMQEVIIRVNDRSFTMGYFVNMTRRTILQGKATGHYEPSVTAELIGGTIGEIQNDEILRQAAPRLGIIVTDQDVQDQLEILLGRPLGGDDSGSPRAERTLDELYRQRLNMLRLSDAEYQDVVRADIIRNKLEDILTVELPRAAEQVHVFVIQVEERADADAALARLRAGEDFSRVVDSLSIHPETRDNGGDWGWFPRRIKPQFDDVWFSLNIGEISETLEIIDGSYIVKVVDHAPFREIAPEHMRLLKLQVLDGWLQEERKRNDMWQNWDMSRYQFVSRKLREDPLLASE